MPSLRDHDDFAVLDVADETRADDVERAGFGGEDITAVEFAENQRADAERIARADQLLVRQADQRIGAFDLAQRLDEPLDDARTAAARDEMQDDFGVGGRLEDRAIADEIAAQRQAVGQIAVMGDGEAAGADFGEQRLDIAQNGFAGGRIAHMADGAAAGQAFDGRGFGEMFADKAEPAFRIEPVAVEADDARRFLSAMLQGVQAERGDRRRGRMAEDAEDAAFFAQPVGFQVERRKVIGPGLDCLGRNFSRHIHGPVSRFAWAA